MPLDVPHIETAYFPDTPAGPCYVHFMTFAGGHAALWSAREELSANEMQRLIALCREQAGH